MGDFMNYIKIDTIKFKNEDFLQVHLNFVDGKQDFIIMEFNNNGSVNYLVLGKIDLKSMVQNHHNFSKLIPTLHGIVADNKKSLLRSQRLESFSYTNLLQSPLLNYIKFTKEGYDFLTAKYDYTKGVIQRTFELNVTEKDNKRVYLLPSDFIYRQEEINTKFFDLNDLEENYFLNAKDAEHMNEKDLKKYIGNNKKKIKNHFDNLQFSDYVDIKYKNEYDSKSSSLNSLDDMAFRYFSEKHQDSWLNLSQTVKKEDKELLGYIKNNINRLKVVIPFDEVEQEKINYFKQGQDIEKIIFTHIVNEYEEEWFNPKELIELTQQKIEEFVEKNQMKLMEIMKKDERYMSFYEHVLNDRDAIKRLIVFFIDYKFSKLVNETKNQEVSDDRETKRIK